MADFKDDIEKYLKGELSPSEMHALEKKALNDPFLEDALEGAKQISSTNFDADLTSLHAALDKRIHGKSTPVVSIWTWPARIAAGLILVALSTFLIIQLTGNDPDRDLALQNEKPALPKESEAQDAAAADSIQQNENLARQPQRAVAESKAASPRAAEKPSSDASGLASAAPSDEDSNVAEEKRDETIVSDSLKIEPGVSLAQAPTEAETQAQGKKSKTFSKRESDDASRKDGGEGPASKAKGLIAPVNTKVVRGRVVSEDGVALPGVNVMIKGTNMGTVTDGSGNYQISIGEDDPSLVFSFIGFTSTEIPTAEKSQLDVQLDQDVSQLSEVVVVGYGAERPADETPETLELATPAGGRKAFKQYLEGSIKYPEQALANNIEGRVTIQFTVESSGQLSNFKVIKGIGHGCDEELIRLVKQGPKWTPTRRNNDSLRDKVKVRMKFALPKK